MPKDKSELKLEGRISFYAVLLNRFKNAAADLGYMLTVHGSMANDLDLIAVAWTEDAKPVKELVKAISDCMGATTWKKHHFRSRVKKPHGRLAYTLSWFSDWRIDLSVMPPKRIRNK